MLTSSNDVFTCTKWQKLRDNLCKSEMLFTDTGPTCTCLSGFAPGGFSDFNVKLALTDNQKALHGSNPSWASDSSKLRFLTSQMCATHLTGPIHSYFMIFDLTVCLSVQPTVHVWLLFHVSKERTVPCVSAPQSRPSPWKGRAVHAQFWLAVGMPSPTGNH